MQRIYNYENVDTRSTSCKCSWNADPFVSHIYINGLREK